MLNNLRSANNFFGNNDLICNDQRLDICICIHSNLLEHAGHFAIDILFKDKQDAHHKHDSQSRKCICLKTPFSCQ